MPTPTKGRRLGGSSAHQKHMLANLATALFEHGKITTTEARARRLRPFAERLITQAKRGDLHARRQVLTVVTDKGVVHTLFTEIGPSFATRDGGYTRITKIGPRKGDNAPLAVIELVKEEAEARSPRRRRIARRPATAAPARAAATVTAPAQAQAEAEDTSAEDTSAEDTSAEDTRAGETTAEASTEDSGDEAADASSAAPALGMTRSAEPDPGTLRIRLDLSYDGSGFHGWASQPGLRTVQDELERALATVLGLPAVRLTVAGRTDTGVHARGQVAHTDVPAAQWPPDAGPVLRRLGGLLPPDVRVRAIGPAPGGFDARFAALWRRYSYRVCDDLTAADPLRRGDTLWHPRPLDVALMNEAAAALTGEHDFAAFCRRREGASTVRALLRLEWQRTAPGLAEAAVVADAFCHNMVRSLTGALLAVGDGRKPPGWAAEVLAARRRDPAVHVAPAHALCLEEVRYPEPGGLAARAAATRRVRPSCR